MEKLQVKDALSAFQVVMDRGIEKNGEHLFDGMYASTDLDGYNVYLRDEHVQLHIMFHNRFNLEYRNRLELDAFLDRIEKLNRLDARAGQQE